MVDDSAFQGDMPITEHLRLALQDLPQRSFPPFHQYDNVRNFLRQHVEDSGKFQLTKGELHLNFSYGNFESNEDGWQRLIASNILDWDGYRFIISRRLLEEEAPPWLRTS